MNAKLNKVLILGSGALKIGEAIRDVTKLRGQVELVLPGTLPNDGKVIEDARSYK